MWETNSSVKLECTVTSMDLLQRIKAASCSDRDDMAAQQQTDEDCCRLFGSANKIVLISAVWVHFFFSTSQINVVEVTGSTAKEAPSTVLTVESFVSLSTFRCRRPPIKWPPSTAGKTKVLFFLSCSQLFRCACTPLFNIFAVSPPLLTFAKLPAESAASSPSSLLSHIHHRLAICQSPMHACLLTALMKSVPLPLIFHSHLHQSQLFPALSELP